MKGMFFFWTSDPSSEGFAGPGWYYAESDGVFGHPALRLGGPFDSLEDAQATERHNRVAEGVSSNQLSERNAGA